MAEKGAWSESKFGRCMGAAVTGGSSSSVLEREQSCTGVWDRGCRGMGSVQRGPVGTQEQDMDFSGMG